MQIVEGPGLPDTAEDETVHTERDDKEHPDSVPPSGVVDSLPLCSALKICNKTSEDLNLQFLLFKLGLASSLRILLLIKKPLEEVVVDHSLLVDFVVQGDRSDRAEASFSEIPRIL